MTPSSLRTAFSLYWSNMERCQLAGAYWSLLHVTLCLPDICAALESSDGETKRSLYIAWCDKYLPDKLLDGAERYRMRCKVLHQGRASLGQKGRYTGFSFAEPAQTGHVDHRRIEGSTLVLDVGRLAAEYRAGVELWIQHLEAVDTTPQAVNVKRNLPSLVRVRRFPIPPTSGAVVSSLLPRIDRTS